MAAVVFAAACAGKGIACWVAARADRRDPARRAQRRDPDERARHG